jgi:hypothetical protein
MELGGCRGRREESSWIWSWEVVGREQRAAQSEGERQESPDALLHLLHSHGEQCSDWPDWLVIFHSNSRGTHQNFS